MRATIAYVAVLFLFGSTFLNHKRCVESKPTTNRTRAIRQTHSTAPCTVLPPVVLSDVLGPAFNSRYMSIENPIDSEAIVETDESYNKYSVQASQAYKRKTNSYRPFYVDDTYVSQISDQPAWEVKHAIGQTARDKRAAAGDADEDIFGGGGEQLRSARRANGAVPLPPRGERPWKCESQIKWLDLGKDYFPRYLRTVECTKQFCWYGHYSCQPRSFTVKLLRRRSGECVHVDRQHRIGVNGIPGELRELWIWEERAVNFCCECALP